MTPSYVRSPPTRAAGLLGLALGLVLLGAACDDARPSQNPGGAPEDGTPRSKRGRATPGLSSSSASRG
jgi:hypothetical protein